MNELSNVKSNFHPQHSKSKSKFVKFYNKSRKRVLSKDGRAVSTKQLAFQMGIGYAQFRKIIYMQRPTSKRDFIIALCALLYLNAHDTNQALSLYFDENCQLDANSDDRSLIGFLDAEHNTCETERELISIDDLNFKLIKKQIPPLHIINHRAVTKRYTDEIRRSSPYDLLDKQTECHADELLYGDPYDSLETLYWLDRYHITARMWLDDCDHKKVYRLEYDSTGDLIQFESSEKGSESHVYNSIDNTGVFYDCFKELQRMVMAEKQRMANVLNDTRNYRERKSARIIEGELHVFYETFNYCIPELGEYFFMDYVNGQYTLYITCQSRFMRPYLDTQEYRSMYGNVPDVNNCQYTSLQELEAAVKNARPERKKITQLYIRAYKKAQEEINCLIESLRTGVVFIRNLDSIYDNQYDVLSYYQVVLDYQCICNDKVGEIIDVGVDSVPFTLTNGQIVELSVNDLIQGFQLGLDSIDKVGALKQRKNSLDIDVLLGRKASQD